MLINYINFLRDVLQSYREKNSNIVTWRYWMISIFTRSSKAKDLLSCSDKHSSSCWLCKSYQKVHKVQIKMVDKSRKRQSIQVLIRLIVVHTALLTYLLLWTCTWTCKCQFCRCRASKVPVNLYSLPIVNNY